MAKSREEIIHAACELLETEEEKYSCHALNRAQDSKGYAHKYTKLTYTYLKFIGNDGGVPMAFDADDTNHTQIRILALLLFLETYEYYNEN